MDKIVLKELTTSNNLQAIAYFFFTLAMINLSVSLKNTPEASFEEWKYLKRSLLIFIAWSTIAFVKTILNIVNKIGIIPTYFLNIEYLIILTAAIFLSIGLYKVYQKMRKIFI